MLEALKRKVKNYADEKGVQFSEQEIHNLARGIEFGLDDTVNYAISDTIDPLIDEFEVVLHHEKDGEITTTEYCNKPITKENLDYVLVQFISNFGCDVIEIRKNGEVLTESEVKEITKQFPSETNYEKWNNFFHSHL